MREILATERNELESWLADHGERQQENQPANRSRLEKPIRLGNFIFHRNSELIDGSPEALTEDFTVLGSKIAHHHRADDGTEKLLIELSDGKRIECVLLRDGIRRTICVSSQVGCAMGCVFCASGLDGVDRNLTRGEILEQMLRLQSRLPKNERISHIVMMGMGEPLANLDCVSHDYGDWYCR